MAPKPSGRPRPAWFVAEEQRRRRCGGLCSRLPVRFCGAWVCFALLLSFCFYMSHPSTLRSSRQIGFQAFESVINPQHTVPAHNDAGSTTDNLAVASSSVAGPSYPLDVYAPQVPNPVPLTEITVMSCFPSWLSKCKPLTTPEKDARLGPWVLVDRPLDPDTAYERSSDNTGIGGMISFDFLGQMMAAFETKFVFYRRSRRTDVPRVVDIRLVQIGAQNRPVGGNYAGWHRVKTDLRTTILSLEGKQNPVHMYYRTVGGTEIDHDGEEGLATGLSAEEEKLNDDPITEIDVTYGTGPPWPGFERIGVVAERQEDVKVAQVSLTARRTPAPPPSMPVDPLFRQDGTFKIMQLADLHYSVRHEDCRDVGWQSPSKPCIADNDTVTMIERWLDDEKPDMVVFSGDQLNGQKTSWDEKSVIPKWVKPVIDRKIPWASIQGNHDSQSGVLTRQEQQGLLTHLPYSVTRIGPQHLHDGTGAGNFYVRLRSPKPDGIHLFTLYFLDSGEYAPTDPWHPFTFQGYDWVRQDQIDWLLDVSKKVKAIERPYAGDGAKDLGQIWSRSVGDDDLEVRSIKKMQKITNRQAQATHLSKPKAMLFVHIPVPEAFDAADVDAQGNAMQFGPMNETSTTEGAQKVKGLFDAVNRRSKEEQDVIAMLHGHMHLNAGCRRVRNVWTCFNGGSSFAGYGLKGFERRTRILQLSQWGQKVTTWQRHESTPGRVEEHTLYDEQ